MSLNYLGTIIVSAALLSLVACEPPRPQSGGNDSTGSDSQSRVFPLDRNLISADERAVTGTVLGKQGDRIAFRRTVDQAEFLIAITTLVVVGSGISQQTRRREFRCDCQD